jgi:hypothetical protein
MRNAQRSATCRTGLALDCLLLVSKRGDTSARWGAMRHRACLVLFRWLPAVCPGSLHSASRGTPVSTLQGVDYTEACAIIAALLCYGNVKMVAIQDSVEPVDWTRDPAMSRSMKCRCPEPRCRVVGSRLEDRIRHRRTSPALPFRERIECYFPSARLLRGRRENRTCQ